MNIPESKSNEIPKKLHNPLLRFLFRTELRRGVNKARRPSSAERVSSLPVSGGAVRFIGD